LGINGPSPSVIEARPFDADLGPATATGFLFIVDPVEDSFVCGTLSVLGLEDVSFEARLPGPPVRINVLKVTVVISFDPVLRAFTGSAEQPGVAPQQPTTIVNLA